MFAMFEVLEVLVVVVGGLCLSPSRDVLTTQGVVRGYLVDNPQVPYYAYRAIFYARVKYNRFKSPKPARRWDGTFEATYQVKCPQPGAGAEDCLVLNVFSAAHAQASPVLVLVHDGDFQSGWGAFQPPTRLLAQDLLIVTFNYRLGSLGFLCLGTLEVPGNAGLKDQVAALYWVQKNIANFGGDPYDVTVYGIGSGASAVQLLLLSGAARGLLHKAILESGSALSPLSLSYDPVLTAFDAAVAMGYTGKVNAGDLAKYYKGLPVKKQVNSSIVFLPCLENSLAATHSLLEEDPVETFKQRNYQQVPVLIAYINMLGALKTESRIVNSNLPENFENLLPNNLEFENSDMKHRVAKLVKQFYLGQLGPDENSDQNYVEYFNDVTYEYPIIKSAVLNAATSNAPTYLMKFLAKGDSKNPSEKTKCCKNILDYFYDTNGGDQTTVQRLVTLWSNFIRIGDPTPLTTSVVPVLWQPVKSDNDNFDVTSVTGLVVGRTVQMNSRMAHNGILFWDQIYKKFYRFHVPRWDV